jgi:hypothetical protein
MFYSYVDLLYWLMAIAASSGNLAEKEAVMVNPSFQDMAQAITSIVKSSAQAGRCFRNYQEILSNCCPIEIWNVPTHMKGAYAGYLEVGLTRPYGDEYAMRELEVGRAMFVH